MTTSDEVIFAEYAHRVIALAEANIGKQLARRIDGEDVAQSVFRTFFRRQKEGQFKIDNSLDLWALLMKITLAKVRSQARKHTAEIRDVGAEQDAGDWIDEIRSREPGPLDAAVFLDLLERVVEDLPELHAKVLSMRMDNMSKVEIAKELGVARQTVHRVLHVITTRLEKLSSESL